MKWPDEPPRRIWSARTPAGNNSIRLDSIIEQNRGIDLSHLGINRRMVEKPGQAAQKLTENADRHLVH
jgi:hypothetical protein